MHIHTDTWAQRHTHITCRKEAVNKTGLALAIPPNPSHGLQVHRRVPVAVKQDQPVGPHQVQPRPSCPGRQQADLQAHCQMQDKAKESLKLLSSHEKPRDRICPQPPASPNQKVS